MPAAANPMMSCRTLEKTSERPVKSEVPTPISTSATPLATRLASSAAGPSSQNSGATGKDAPAAQVDRHQRAYDVGNAGCGEPDDERPHARKDQRAAGEERGPNTDQHQRDAARDEAGEQRGGAVEPE